LKKLHFLFFIFAILSIAFVFNACKKHEAPTPIEPTTQTPQVPESERPPSETKITEESGPKETSIEDITRMMQPVFFDYDKSDIRDDQAAALQTNASVLKQNSTANVLIEGHCDERGTVEYNLALGDRRAKTAKDYLVNLGIAENRISTISYGESRPFADGHDEDAWHQNRRAQFIAVKK
jgi:peptidoglycan-associated lipoprotein